MLTANLRIVSEPKVGTFRKLTEKNKSERFYGKKKSIPFIKVRDSIAPHSIQNTEEVGEDGLPVSNLNLVHLIRVVELVVIESKFGESDRERALESI